MIVTDTWVMKVTTYRVHVAQQQDVRLTVTEAQQHELSPDSHLPVQLLTIRVASANPAVPAFHIRLNSTEYGELCEKLRAPIRSAANVVIHQSLGDLFLETFASLVEVNPAYSVPSSQDLEACIGCMQTRASVKLVKTCQEVAVGECQQCYCRPMWCLTCMGKWFASRQDPQRPDTWLASRVPCPTCRALLRPGRVRRALSPWALWPPPGRTGLWALLGAAVGSSSCGDSLVPRLTGAPRLWKGLAAVSAEPSC